MTILQKYNLDINLTEIQEKYSEIHRFYHTFEHIEFLINKKFELDEKEREILILTALFHDIIYNSQKTDNELQSVNFLKSKLIEEITTEIEQVCNIILTTKSHKKTNDKLTNIFCELDMWRLSNGSFIDIFEDERKIFKEYQYNNYNTYKINRIKFLNSIKLTYGINNTQNIDLLIDWISTQKINVGVYAGSFNPFHKGHYDILQKGQKIFDKIILAIGINPEKSTSPGYIQKLKLNIQKLQEKLNIEICFYDGLLTSFIKEKQIQDKINITLIRGLRDGFDLTYENKQIQFMKDIYSELKTIYIQSERNLDHISSSAIKYLEKYDKELVKKYLP